MGLIKSSTTVYDMLRDTRHMHMLTSACYSHAGADVLLTDVAEVMPLLRRNYENNISPAALRCKCSGGMGSVSSITAGSSSISSSSSSDGDGGGRAGTCMCVKLGSQSSVGLPCIPKLRVLGSSAGVCDSVDTVQSNPAGVRVCCCACCCRWRLQRLVMRVICAAVARSRLLSWTGQCQNTTR